MCNNLCKTFALCAHIQENYLDKASADDIDPTACPRSLEKQPPPLLVSNGGFSWVARPQQPPRPSGPTETECLRRTRSPRLLRPSAPGREVGQTLTAVAVEVVPKPQEVPEAWRS